MLKKQARNGMALFLILMLIFADAYTISNLIAPPYRHAKRQDSPIEDNTTPLKVFQMGSLSKIYPRVEKQINRSPTETQLTIVVTNTLNTPIHNFTLTYWRIKDSVEEHYLDSNVSTDALTKFTIQIREDESRIVFNFTMRESSSLNINESVILSSKFYANRSESDLIGDGVYWRCAESFSASDFYTIDDPTQSLLDPLQESATPDFDDDGIPNIQEFELGLDPFTPDLWLRWISLSNETLLKSEDLPYPNYLYGGQVHIGIPKSYENLSLTFKIVNLGIYTQIINLSLNSHLIYDSVSLINYNYLLEPNLTSGRQNVEFIVKSSNSSYDIQFDIVFKVGNFIPLDISNDSIDHDGDTLLDSYETELGSNINDPDSDNDGVPDGYDLDPLASDMYYAHTTKAYKLPVFYTDSYIRFSIQVNPIIRDYTIDKFPFGAKFLKISPALRVIGTNPPEGKPIGDYLPDVRGIVEDKIGYIPLSPLRDQHTGALLCYMATFDYKKLNLAKIDHFINLTFEIVWLATEMDEGGNQTLLHIFDVQQDFIIQGFYISETFGIDINVAILGDGLNKDATYKIQPTVSAVASWESCRGESNLLFSLKNIPDLYYLSKKIKDMDFLNSTIEELENNLSHELGLDSPKNRTYIITQTVNTTKYTLTTWRLVEAQIYHDPFQEFLESLAWKIPNTIIAITGIFWDLSRIWSSVSIIYALYLLPAGAAGYVGKLRLFYTYFKNVFSQMEEGAFSSYGVALGKGAEWGKTLGQISKVFAVIEIAIGVVLAIYGGILLREGYAYTGWKNIIVGGLLTIAGIAAFVPGWGTLIGVILGFVALLVDYFWDGIATLFHLEDPNPRFDITEDKFGITEFDKSMQYSSLTPGSETNMRMSTEINVSGNVDFKFRAQLRIGEGAWGPLVETAQLPPGSVQNITASDEIEEYGTITSADYYFAAYNYQTNEWISNTVTIPLNLTVYPTDIATFWQMVWDGSWLRGRQGVLLAAVPNKQTIERGENLDSTVDIYNEAGTPQQFKIDLLESYGEVTSVWVIKYQRIDVYHVDFGYAWHGWYYVPYREQIATQFPFITPIIGSNKNGIDNHYQFGFTLKTPSECTFDVYGAQHLLLYAQSITEPDIIQFRQINYTVTSTRDYTVGITPNTELKVPGENASWAIELYNVGLTPDNYILSLDAFGAIDPAQVSLSLSQIRLGPCQGYFIPIEASIPQTWSLSPGDYLNLTITSQNHPENTCHHSLLRILPFHDLSLNALQPNITIRPGTPASFEVTINNSGNVPEVIKASILLDGFNPSPFSSPTSIQIQPGDTNQTIFQLDAAREPLLAPGTYTLHLYLLNEEDLLLINTSMLVTVLDFHDVQLTADPSEIGSSERPKAIYEDRPSILAIQVKNIGNTPDQFALDLFPINTQNNMTLSVNLKILAPNEVIPINVTFLPQVRGVETFYIVVHFIDENGILQMKNISCSLNVIDEDTLPPTVYFVDAVPSSVTDAQMASNTYYRIFQWAVNDSSGIYERNASYDGVPVEPQLIIEPTLMIYNRTPDATDIFNMATPESPALLSVKHTFGESLGKYSFSNSMVPPFLNYLTFDITSQGGQIYGIRVLRNGEEIAPLGWDLLQSSHSTFDVAIPREIGVYQYDVTIKTYYWLNIYHAYMKTFHIQLFAAVGQVNCSYSVEIPIQPGLHNLTIVAIDNDFDLNLPEDRAGIIVNRTIQILDDDTAPPEIHIGALNVKPEDLLAGTIALDFSNLTGTPVTIDDQFAQYGFPRWVLWALTDASGFSKAQITYEIEGFDGRIILPEKLIFNESLPKSDSPQTLAGFFICSLILGYHRFRVNCTDGDLDRQGDTLSSYTEYVLTIRDDDVTPLELLNLTVNSELQVDGVPMVEAQARITDPTFAQNPDLFKFLIFVDNQWVPNVAVSYDWVYDQATTPPTFQEARVKFRFENTWATQGLLGNHTVEIVTIDDDSDIISANPNPFAAYSGYNFETYQIVQMVANLTLYNIFGTDYSAPIPISLADYFFNQSTLYQAFLPWLSPFIIFTTAIVGLFGFPPINYTIIDPNGELYSKGKGISPFCSVILPSFYGAAQLFFIIVHNGILQTQGLPWNFYNESQISLTREKMEVPCFEEGGHSNTTQMRETLMLTIYPELLFGTPTLYQTLQNGTKHFNPTERLTITYDLTTGIALRLRLDHLSDPTVPGDVNRTYLEMVLEDTNLLMPYEFEFHNQVLPVFVPVDAAIKSFFTQFEVAQRYGLEATLAPSNQTIFDNQSALFTLKITNTGDLADTFRINLQNLTLSSSRLATDAISSLNGTLALALLPRTSALVNVTITPLKLGREAFNVLIDSVGGRDFGVKAFLNATLVILDDDTTPPNISNLTIKVGVLDLLVSLATSDASGIGSFEFQLNGTSISPINQSEVGNTYSFVFQNRWVMEYGAHNLTVTVWDADNDHPGDSLATAVEGTFEITGVLMKQFVLWEIDQFAAAIQNSSLACWANPAGNKKSTMLNQVQELRDLVAANSFRAAYEKLLHDIAPKLTGERTDRNENRCGTKGCPDFWVICPSLQEIFRSTCNQLLTHLIILKNAYPSLHPSPPTPHPHPPSPPPPSCAHHPLGIHGPFAHRAYHNNRDSKNSPDRC